MANRLLFIVEGDKSEPDILKNMEKIILKETNSIICSFENNIYELYKKMRTSENLNIVEVLNKIKNIELIPEEFTDIFLFFDYDGHDSKANDEKIIEMLEFFNNSTTNGKLYINYPMVESIKIISLEAEKLFYDIAECSSFKDFIDKVGENRLNNVKRYNYEIWQEIIYKNLFKVNFLLNDNFNNLDLEKIYLELKDGLKIFLKQKEKYIDKEKKILILNSFPIFICNFIKKSYFKKLVGN